MSWWDASGFSSFATQVVKTAQKKIDKVLDIEGQTDILEPASTVVSATSASKPKSEEKDFWNAWLPKGTVASSEEEEDGSALESKLARESAASPVQSALSEKSSLLQKQKPDKKTDTLLAKPKEKEGKEDEKKEESISWNFGWGVGSADKEGKPETKSWSDFDFKDAASKRKTATLTSRRELKSPLSLTTEGVQTQSEKKGGTGKEKRLVPKKSPRTSLSPSSSVSSSTEEKARVDADFAEQSLTASDLSDLPGSVKTSIQDEKDFLSQTDALPPKTDDVEGHDLIHCDSGKQTLLEHQDAAENSADDDEKQKRMSGGEVQSQIMNLKDQSLLSGQESSETLESTANSNTVIVDSNQDSENSFSEIFFGNLHDSSSAELVQFSHVSEDNTVDSSTRAQNDKSVSNEPVQDEQLKIQVDGSMSMSTSESSILTLSSPGQDEQVNQLNVQESMIRSADSDYLNISGSGPAMISVQSLSSVQSNVSIQSFTSDQSVTSVKELADSSPETESANRSISAEVAKSCDETEIVEKPDAPDDTDVPQISDSSDVAQVVESDDVQKDVEVIHSTDVSDVAQVSDIPDKAAASESEDATRDGDDSNTSQTADRSAADESGDKETLEHTDVENDSSDTSKLDSSMDTCTSGDTVLEKTGHAEDSGSENEKGEGSLPCVSLNGSYVKCMLEEAMEEKPEDSGSDHHSSGEKSESSKFESEGDKSVSGHESSDEIETTTSSDIEIISTPNGESYVKPFDLSPLRIALQKTAGHGGHAHRRTDSQSSGSTYSKTGESDQMSPGRDSLERQDQESGDEERSTSELHAVYEEDSNSPYHPQKLLQKLAEKEEILQHRENKLVQLSKENNDLLEANSILRNQLQQLEELRETEMSDLNTLTDEFTKRLSEAEHKTLTVIREKESIKQQLETTQKELSKRSADVNLQAVLAEKDEIIAELRQEGEKLSKQQLQSNTIIKKLRAKEKENESLISSQKTKLETLTKEVEHLRKVCASKEDLEKKQTEAINQLNMAIQKQMKEVETLKGELEEAHEKTRSLQVTLDGSYKEIAELHKHNAAQDSKAQQVALSASLKVREELEMTLEKEKQRFKYEKEALIVQIEDLRMTMSRMERDHNRREDLLKQEISDLHQQLQEDEARNQELAQAVSSATKPLLRQIENLQSTYSAQSQSWEKVEKSLTERLGEVQNQLAFSVEKERTANENVMSLTSRVTALDSQCTRLRQEKAQLQAQAEMDKAKIELLEDAKHSEMAQVEAVKNQMTKEITELKKQKVFLETQLEMEKSKLESEKRKTTIIEEQLRMMEKERPQSRGTPSPVSVSRQESVSSFAEQPYWFTTLPQEEMLERGLVLGSPNGSKVNLYESLRQSGAATILENLQSQLKQREGEIVQLQSDIANLERTRESMARELVSLTNQNDELKEQIQEVPALQAKLQDVNQRYHALLQMYGEKVEQTEELKLDLADIKEMYKAQIDQLLAK